MSFYENLVMQTQMNYSRYYSLYAAGKTPYALSEKPALSYEEQIERLVKEIREAECVLVGEHPDCRQQEAGISTMKITLLTENISENMRRNTISKEPLTV